MRRAHAELRFNHSYDYTPSIPNDATYTMLGQLFHEAYGSALSDTTHSAAFQLAIWEIIYDGDLDLGVGAIQGDERPTVTPRR